MTLYAAVPGTLVALPGRQALWRRYDDRERRVLDGTLAAALSHCAAFASRTQHVERLARLAAVDVGAAARWFDALQGLGLLKPADAYLPAPGTAPPPLPEPLLVIRVWQRPLALARLLDSLLDDERRWGVTRRVVLVDDTLDAAHAASTRELAIAFARRRGAPVGLIGPAQRDAALALLHGALPPSERARLGELLDPAFPSAVTGSRSWNFAVLLAAGGALAILDDDVEFPLRRFPSGDGRFELADSTEAVVRFHDDDESLLAAPPLEAEPFAWLARWFERDAGAWFAALGVAHEALPQRRPDELLALDQRRRVLGVVPGLWGGIAFNSSVYLTYANPATRDDLWRAPYRHERLEADRVWHGYPRPRLATHAVYTPLLLDARALLPFAGTWGRVDDTLFLSALRAIEPNACFAHVPALLGHRDLAPRGRLARARQPLLLDRNAWLAHVVDAFGQGLKSAERGARLATLGALLADLAASTDAELAHAVIAFRAHMQLRIVEHLDAALEKHAEAPAPWREHAAAIVAANRAALVDERIAAEELGIVRRALVQYAGAAALWPVAWEAARRAFAGQWPHPAAEALS